VLHVPALYVLALWLHGRGRGSGNDELIPIAPTPPAIEAGRVYPAAALLRLLRERARRMPPPGEEETRGG
jgi:hypothetical protein